MSYNSFSPIFDVFTVPTKHINANYFKQAVPKAFLIPLTVGGGDKIESSHVPLSDAAFLFISEF